MRKACKTRKIIRIHPEPGLFTFTFEAETDKNKFIKLGIASYYSNHGSQPNSLTLHPEPFKIKRL